MKDKRTEMEADLIQLCEDLMEHIVHTEDYGEAPVSMDSSDYGIILSMILTKYK